MSKIINTPDEFNTSAKSEPDMNIEPINIKRADGESMVYDVNRVAGGKTVNMINKKGKAFPMVQPNQNMPEQQVNRAGRSPESNMLTNDPNINQPMNKVAASTAKRENMFGQIASDQGQFTPQASVFPQQGANSTFGMYDGPSQAKPDFLDLDGDGNKSEPMKEAANDAPSMSYGPNKALVGDQENLNEGLKAAIKAAPGMYGKGPNKVKGKKGSYLPDQNYMYKGKRVQGQQTGEIKKDGLLKRKYVENLDTGEKMKLKDLNIGGEGPSMRSAFKAFENDHLKTKVTKSNLKATERDDAAHMSYLKRDIKYDASHGGSKKQMLNDEKHISKLAGDLKYDAKKKRKYDNV
tara:strand:- start:1064 stop:2113 length:1050 start_codon:yes stop_codon:yes gene_type:complete